MADKEQIALLFQAVTEKKADLSVLEEQEVTVLMKLANRLKKYKKDQPEGKLRIAVLGSHSIQHFVAILQVMLYSAGLDPEFYEGEYDGINMDVLDPQSSFYSFQPQIAILMMHAPDIRIFPPLLCDTEEYKKYLKKQMSYFTGLWDAISKIEGCQILQTNIALPYHRELGNQEAGLLSSGMNYYRGINLSLAAEKRKNVTIMDMEYMSSLAGKRNWFDYSSYFLTKAGFSVEYLGMVTAAFARQIQAMRGKVRKCLILDLDNTLWGGVVGDDGYDGIQLDPHHAVGEAYRYFQKYILSLKERGVILAVCSKNEADTAKLPFEKNAHMILKLSDIACFMANWNDKAQNIRMIAKELNIGTDSCVFVDDNPAEREIVKNYLPEVMVIDLPEDPAEYATALELADPFEWAELTKEDLKRSDSYITNRQRQELEESFVNYGEYLQALHMEASVGEPEEHQIERFAQLINKSNQFNLRTIRYTEAQINSMKNDTDVRMIYVDLKDKFSEYGIISCIILKKSGNDCFIDTWLMSCRVLKRGVENLAFAYVLAAAKEWGCTRVIGEYIPSAKNMMVKNFYQELGFSPLENGLKTTEDSVQYEYPADQSPDVQIYIKTR